MSNSGDAVRRPTAVACAVWAQAIAISAVVAEAVAVMLVAGADPIKGRYLNVDPAAPASPGRLLGALFVIAAWIALVSGVFRGVNWTRITLTVLGPLLGVVRWLGSPGPGSPELRLFPGLVYPLIFEVVADLAVIASLVLMYLGPADRYFSHQQQRHR